MISFWFKGHIMDKNSDTTLRDDGSGKTVTVAEMEYARRDVLLGCALFLLGAFAFYYALQMPVAELYGAKWYTAPALLPEVLSLGLMATSIFLIIKSLRISGGFTNRDMAKTIAYLKSKQFFRLALAAVTLTIYLFVLLGNMHYILATFIYLFGTMFLFRTATTWKSVLIMLAVSFIVAYGVGYGFAELARIPLP